MASTLYEKIVEDIAHKINKGQFAPGEMIPSENSLCKEYSASRITIRRSLALLSESGYIYSVPGKGSFVRKPSNDFHILRFNELEIIKEYVDRVTLLEVRIILPTKELMKKLNVTKNQKVVVTKRLFSSRKEPIAYDVKYLPYDKHKPIVEEMIQYATFPEIVSQNTPLFSIKKELTITAVNPTEEEQSVLNVGPGYSLLVVEQKLVSEQGMTVGWGRIFFKGEYCQLQAISSKNDRITKGSL